MKIYTKKGDYGETKLLTGEMVKKSDERIEVQGQLDELNSVLGIIRSLEKKQNARNNIMAIQKKLFEIGTMISSPAYGKNFQFLAQDDVRRLEREIDIITQKLSPLKNFIIPGESLKGAYYDLARSVCRRVERSIVKLNQYEKVTPVILQYLNRLSDFLFTREREAYFREKKGEKIWKKKLK